MKFYLLTVGRSQPEYQPLVEDYKKRINRFAPFEEVIVQYKAKKNDTASVIMKEEGKKIREKIPKNDEVFLLDENGKEFTSKAFATVLNKQMQTPQNCWFVIGGAFGFSDEMYNVAHQKISLSKMTFTHQMIRLFFAEQFYRAMTIINNHPYHNS